MTKGPRITTDELQAAIDAARREINGEVLTKRPHGAFTVDEFIGTSGQARQSASAQLNRLSRKGGTYDHFLVWGIDKMGKRRIFAMYRKKGNGRV